MEGGGRPMNLAQRFGDVVDKFDAPHLHPDINSILFNISYMRKYSDRCPLTESMRSGCDAAIRIASAWEGWIRYAGRQMSSINRLTEQTLPDNVIITAPGARPQSEYRFGEYPTLFEYLDDHIAFSDTRVGGSGESFGSEQIVRNFLEKLGYNFEEDTVDGEKLVAPDGLDTQEAANRFHMLCNIIAKIVRPVATTDPGFRKRHFNKLYNDLKDQLREIHEMMARPDAAIERKAVPEHRAHITEVSSRKAVSGGGGGGGGRW